MTERLVFILDDNNEFRESARWLLEGLDYEVQDFSEPTAALDALAAVRKVQPCCLLLDIRMPTMSGLDVHDQMRQQGIDVPVIYMTGHADVPLAVAAMGKGALMFLEKPLDETDLEAALTKAFSEPVQRRRKTREERDQIQKSRDQLAALTPREAELLDGIMNDRSNRMIADELGISIKTVEFHRAKLMRKLQAKNAAHLQRLVSSSEVV